MCWIVVKNYIIHNSHTVAGALTTTLLTKYAVGLILDDKESKPRWSRPTHDDWVTSSITGLCRLQAIMWTQKWIVRRNANGRDLIITFYDASRRTCCQLCTFEACSCWEICFHFLYRGAWPSLSVCMGRVSPGQKMNIFIHQENPVATKRNKLN